MLLFLFVFHIVYMVWGMQENTVFGENLDYPLLISFQFSGANILELPFYRMKFWNTFYLYFLLYIAVFNFASKFSHNVEFSILRRSAWRGYRDEQKFHMMVLQLSTRYHFYYNFTVYVTNVATVMMYTKDFNLCIHSFCSSHGLLLYVQSLMS